MGSEKTEALKALSESSSHIDDVMVALDKMVEAARGAEQALTATRDRVSDIDEAEDE